MRYVLDTNVFSKMLGPKPNANIDKWLQTVDDSELFVTAMTIQEIYKGIAQLKKSCNPAKAEAARQIESGCDVLLAQFAGRILPIDELVAREWGRRLAKQGTKNANDLAIISIVAVQADAIAVTRNLIDFRHRGIKVLNPFRDPPAEFDDPET